ncbi:MAG: DnaA regulatory inactivator Hda [Gammaproteobacteria bacterium]|nr:DnaA regulatory inactivator Hda [Gammaproteobacteria bacterium]MDP2139323.1 DnaA regulatory inactivator Hda [Gammaproteobacteria bacterium]MDP2346880.1 DnaA regulatory inactivator Hda [Gammaproteobacteria bacterium]
MSSGLPRQLPLEITLDDHATFDNFFVASLNDQLFDYLTADSGSKMQQYSCIWGSEGAGCTHLLQAICHQSDARATPAFYFPLQNLHEYNPDVFEGLETFSLVCLDDVQNVAGNAEWELALFSLFNRLRENGSQLVVAANVNPRQMPVRLPDLLSRLQSGIVFQLHVLDDSDKLLALQLRARQRGFDLPEEVAAYVLQRNDRRMSCLFDLLDRLDQHSLETQRRITIPLVRELMGWRVSGSEIS